MPSMKTLASFKDFHSAHCVKPKRIQGIGPLYKASGVVCWWVVLVGRVAKYGNIGIFGGLSLSSLCEAEEDTSFGALYKAMGVVCWWVLWVRRAAKYVNIGGKHYFCGNHDL